MPGSDLICIIITLLTTDENRQTKKQYIMKIDVCVCQIDLQMNTHLGCDVPECLVKFIILRHKASHLFKFYDLFYLIFQCVMYVFFNCLLCYSYKQ